MENQFHQWLRDHASLADRLNVPIGDDAAVFDFPQGEQAVFAADAIQDGVHFHLDEHGARAAGRKALAVNLSDMAAMAARPLAATVTLVLPRKHAAEVAREVLTGVFEFGRDEDVLICGGDTNCWDGPLSISVSLLGAAPLEKIWRRSGGKAGDSLVVTGSLGGSIFGRHLSFQPRHRDALHWRNQFEVRAAIDVTDGLLLDASRLAEASDCGALLQLDAVPVSEDAQHAAKTSGRSSLEHALSDGEDFELLLAMPPGEAEQFCRQNPGSCIVGRLDEALGLWRLDGDKRSPLAPAGFEHR